MPHSPQLSVVLLQPLHLDELNSMVENAFQQVGVDYEVLLVGCDRTAAIAPWLQADYPQVRVIHCEADRSRAAMCNLAIGAAVGQYVAFLESGDRWEANYLGEQVKRLGEQPQALFSYCTYLAPNGKEINVEPIYLDLTAAMVLDNFIHSLSQVVFGRSVLRRFGGFDETVGVQYDRAFYLRVLSQGLVLRVNQPLVRRSVGMDSLGKAEDGIAWLADGLQVLERFFARAENRRYGVLRDEAIGRIRDRVVAWESGDLARRGRPLMQAAAGYGYTDDLCVVTAYFNPSHYRTKFENYQKFCQPLRRAGIQLVTVECAFGEDAFDLAPGATPVKVSFCTTLGL